MEGGKEGGKQTKGYWMVIYNSPKTQFLYIDIDNLCDPHRNCKNNLPDGY